MVQSEKKVNMSQLKMFCKKILSDDFVVRKVMLFDSHVHICLHYFKWKQYQVNSRTAKVTRVLVYISSGCDSNCGTVYFPMNMF